MPARANGELRGYRQRQFRRIENVKELLARNEARQHIHFRNQHRGAGDEDDPALEHVQEAVGILRAEMIDHDADEADAQAVHRDRDRDGREEHQHALPQRRLEQIGREKAEAHQRIEIAQAAAGLDHLQLVDAEVDDIAFEIDRDLNSRMKATPSCEERSCSWNESPASTT